MKYSLVFVALGLGTTGVMAQEAGRVISSTPVVQQVAVPRQVCNQQPMIYQQPQTSGGGAIVGAVVGGLLGNTIGHGMGRAAATAAGVVGGAAIGDRVENRPYPQAIGQQGCSTQTTYENRTVGYNVTYEYAGRQYTVQMPYDPGPTVRLNVSPVGSNTAPSGMVQQYGDSTVMPTVIQPAVTVMPAPVVYAPAYYPAYYPGYYPSYYSRPFPVSLSIGYFGGGGYRHHHHWR